MLFRRERKRNSSFSSSEVSVHRPQIVEVVLHALDRDIPLDAPLAAHLAAMPAARPSAGVAAGQM